MVELHVHGLPGVDDGPKSLDAALALIRALASDGVQHAVLTPHIYPGVFDNTPETIAPVFAQLLHAVQRERLGITLSWAAEIRICPEMLAWEREGLLPYLGGPHDTRKAVLIELPDAQLPVGTERLLGLLLEAGVTPVIAHPERNKMLMEQPGRIEPLVQMGCLLQLTAASVLGEFGARAQTAAVAFLDAGWVHVVASDAHNTTARAPRLAAARAWLSKGFGAELADQLTNHHPARLAGLGDVAVQGPGGIHLRDLPAQTAEHPTANPEPIVLRAWQTTGAAYFDAQLLPEEIAAPGEQTAAEPATCPADLRDETLPDVSTNADDGWLLSELDFGFEHEHAPTELEAPAPSTQQQQMPQPLQDVAAPTVPAPFQATETAAAPLQAARADAWALPSLQPIPAAQAPAPKMQPLQSPKAEQEHAEHKEVTLPPQHEHERPFAETEPAVAIDPACTKQPVGLADAVVPAVEPPAEDTFDEQALDVATMPMRLDELPKAAVVPEQPQARAEEPRVLQETQPDQACRENSDLRAWHREMKAQEVVDVEPVAKAAASSAPEVKPATVRYAAPQIPAAKPKPLTARPKAVAAADDEAALPPSLQKQGFKLSDIPTLTKRG
jgi:tyrosine-protein phosphatase YwqE